MLVVKYSREIILLRLVQEIACSEASFPQSKKKRKKENLKWVKITMSLIYLKINLLNSQDL